MNESNQTGANREENSAAQPRSHKQFHRRNADRQAARRGFTDDFMAEETLSPALPIQSDDGYNQLSSTPSDDLLMWNEISKEITSPADAEKPSPQPATQPTVPNSGEELTAAPPHETGSRRQFRQASRKSPPLPAQEAAPKAAPSIGETAWLHYDEKQIEQPSGRQISPIKEFTAMPAYAPTPQDVADDNTAVAQDSLPSQAQKRSHITGILVTVGLAAAVCLVFFCYTLFQRKGNQETPQIFDAKQLGATDSSVLISWRASDAADGYRIQFTDADGVEIVSDCDLPFAVMRNLAPNNTYDVAISALKDGRAYDSKHLNCTTRSYCQVTDILIPKVGSDFVNVTWHYEGADEGFAVVAYTVDANGQRHHTTETAEIPAGEKNECTLYGLTPELKYTVAILPLTAYRDVAKSTFTTASYSTKYDDIDIIRFVICPANSKNATQVHALKQIKPSAPYKTSLILNGKTNKKHTADIAILVTDLKGNLMSENDFPAVHTNPEGKQWFIHRSYLFDFTTPQETGDYWLYLVIDGQYATKTKFTVEE